MDTRSRLFLFLPVYSRFLPVYSSSRFMPARLFPFNLSVYSRFCPFMPVNAPLYPFIPFNASLCPLMPLYARLFPLMPVYSR